MIGNITDIQRFSLNDGDGIRTTIFFKGCNMHCDWCHNPETIARSNDLMFYECNCIGCGQCFEVCKQKVHTMENDKHMLRMEKCIGCSRCVNICFAEALRFSSRSVSTEEVMEEVLQDRAYYDYSGGGVTLSGGEVFCQTDFAESIIDACVTEGINVAVETNLLNSFDKIAPVLRKLALVMFDIKLFDNEMHKKYTGTDNAIVLKNAAEIDELGIPLIVRTPLIPGVTDSDENLLAIAEFVSKLKNVSIYELLNFNPLGESKYKALARSNSCSDARPLSAEKLEHIRTLLKEYNVKIS